jgi:hypothetical protein
MLRCSSSKEALNWSELSQAFSIAEVWPHIRGAMLGIANCIFIKTHISANAALWKMYQVDIWLYLQQCRICLTDLAVEKPQAKSHTNRKPPEMYLEVAHDPSAFLLDLLVAGNEVSTGLDIVPLLIGRHV